MIPSPNGWRTPRLFYFLTNMQAPLPAPITNDGVTDTQLVLKVADDVNSVTDRMKSIESRLLITDTTNTRSRKSLPSPRPRNGEGFHGPPSAGYEQHIEMRFNNLKLSYPRVDQDWLVLYVRPLQLAIGDNLVEIVSISDLPSRTPNYRSKCWNWMLIILQTLHDQ